MKLLIGNEIEVYLKSTQGTTLDIFGILVEATDGELYVQCANPSIAKVWVIPRENVKYCTTTSLTLDDKAVRTQAEVRIEQKPQSEPEPEAQKIKYDPTKLKVYINKEFFIDIPVPPTFNLSNFSDDIMRVYMGNPDVHCYLANKIQKSIEYYPGEVYIEIEDIVPEEITDETVVSNKIPNTFSMGGGKIATKYMDPKEVLAMLENGLKGKKYESKV